MMFISVWNATCDTVITTDAHTYDIKSTSSVLKTMMTRRTDRQTDTVVTVVAKGPRVHKNAWNVIKPHDVTCFQ